MQQPSNFTCRSSSQSKVRVTRPAAQPTSCSHPAATTQHASGSSPRNGCASAWQPRRCLTLRSSRPAPAWHLGRVAFMPIIRLAAKAPRLHGRLSSNVRPHMQGTESAVAEIMSKPGSYCGLPVRDESELLLSLWSNFSLGVWTSWSIFKTGSSAFVRRIEWARGRDRVLVRGEAPTTFGSETPMPDELAQELVRTARAIASQAAPPKNTGIILDGVSRKLVVRAGAAEFLAVQWQLGITGSEPLDCWLEHAAATIEPLLPASSARRPESAA